jgi:DNA-binding response OmpR family regulator
MGLKVGIFEDDKELADFLKELLEENGFAVSLHYGLKEDSWQKSDVVLGDFRNQIVNFETLRQMCVKSSIPLIAISGAETTYTPQLIKPFSMAEMQAAILQQMIATPRPSAKLAARKSS